METFQVIFNRLKPILKKYEAQLVLTMDKAGNYSLDTHKQFKGKPVYFGGVHIKKNYVSFYLMPVYANPDLLSDISSGLRKRMQGKSCFNFKKVDEALFAELERLTDRAVDWYARHDLVLSDR